MTLGKQYQRYTDAHGDPVGDCFRTAIACLLEIDREEVPHFADIYKDKPGLDWWYDAIRFVENRLPGWTLISLRPIYPVYEAENCPEYVILSGDSPRGPWGHSVIVHSRTGELAWDPHPQGSGVGLPWDVFALTTKPQNNFTFNADFTEGRGVEFNGNQ